MYRTTFDQKTKIWYGPNTVPHYNPNVSVGQVLLHALGKCPNKIGQICANNGDQMTNGEIRLNSIRAAQNLTTLGIRFGDVIGFVAKNTKHVASIAFAGLLLGAPINALDSRFKKDEIKHMYTITRPKIIFCDIDVYETVVIALKEIDLDVPIFTMDGKIGDSKDVEELLQETNEENHFIAPDIGDGTKAIALIICTSGSTGLSKGISSTHASILYHLNLSEPTNNEILLSFSTLYWISGISSLIEGTWSNNLRIITTESFSPDLLFDLIEKYKISALMTPPSSLALVLQHPRLNATDFSTLKYYMVTGSYVHDVLVVTMNKLLKNCQISAAYGCSELTGSIAKGSSNERLGSVGQMTSGFQLKLINDDGQQCGINEEGEIYGKGKYPSNGYYNRLELTKEAFGSDGYFRIGDLGRFDEDGYLYIVGRKKEVLKYQNYPISPSEIENCIIAAHSKDIEILSVAGVPDLVSTDLPAVLVVKRKNADITADDISNTVKEKLSDVKQLRGGVYFVDSLPLTKSGKIIRRTVTEIVTKFYHEKMNK